MRMGTGTRDLAALLPLLMISLPAHAAKSGSASLTQEISAHEWNGVRLKNIPMGSKLSVELKTDGPVAIALLTAQEYARFPAAGKAVFRAEAQDELSFSVLAPESSDYYLLIDNRAGDSARSVELTIEAEAPDAARGEE
jgi:hypothetical protein